MTENVAVPVKSRRLTLKIFVPILAVLALLLVYGAGFIALPITILTSLQKGNCQSVISWNQVYTSLYPRSVQDPTLTAPVRECEVYIAAVSIEENGAWLDAYNAYQVYATTYPNGLYSKDVHEHSALTLMNVVKGQVEQKQHEDALSNLNIMLSTYADTSAAAEAWTLVPEVYTSWGTAFREAEDFGRAEQVFDDFKSWSQTNQSAESEVDARHELAKTYVAWGLELQGQKQYEIAITKFEQVVAMDPQSQFDSTDESWSARRNVYVEWGNTLLAQNEFPTAIEKFETAVSLADAEDADSASTALVNGHIQWAASLSSSEDFEGALDQLHVAKEIAQTDAVKQSVDTAFSTTYLEFSNSSGAQSRAGMKEAVEEICEKENKPELPIFGLNPDSVRVNIYGVDAKLPETLAAMTPGELHYVACVGLEKRVVAHDLRTFVVMVKSNIFLDLPFPMDRIKLVWHISLHDSMTAKEVSNVVLEGGTPPPFPKSKADYSNGRYEGAPPSVNDLITWLQSVVK